MYSTTLDMHIDEQYKSDVRIRFNNYAFFDQLCIVRLRKEVHLGHNQQHIVYRMRSVMHTNSSSCKKPIGTNYAA